MGFRLLIVCLGLVDIVEDSLIGPCGYADREALGSAPTLSEARMAVWKRSDKIRHEVTVVREIPSSEVAEMIRLASDRGIESTRIMNAILPIMDKQTRKQYVS